MSYAIGKRFSFEAGHRLGGLPAGHKCARPHGHSYTVEVIVTAGERLGRGSSPTSPTWTRSGGTWPRRTTTGC